MSEFLEMGGYALYVWPSFGLTAVLLVLNVVLARRALNRSCQQARKRIQALEASHEPQA